jgi:nucleoside-diphosphate-sugar epimerase/1-acyl-sn-glycerol-3-phosphate acyltransferase
MARVLVIEARELLGEILVEQLRQCPAVEACQCAPLPEGKRFGDFLSNGRADFLTEHGFDTVAYSPPPAGRRQGIPDLGDAERVFQCCAVAGVKQVVVLSSAAVYGPNCHNPGLLTEARLACRHRKNRIARGWWELEVLAAKLLGKEGDIRLVILRPAPVPFRDDHGPLEGIFHAWGALTLPGYDPSIQLLSPEDLARSVCCAVEASHGGVYNVAPAGVIPLRQALRLAGVKRLPLSYLVQRLIRRVLSPVGLARSADRIEYLRYNWTISNEKITRELGFVPQRSSAEALGDCRLAESGQLPNRWQESVGRRFDDFGFDAKYFALMARTTARFLERYYWRVDVRGLEQVPREGPAVLVGIHRGFMPFDGFLTTHAVAREAGRVPRFLIHPGLVKFPFLHDFMTKQGGLIACNENADYVLQRQELLAIYPEGIHGAFRYYRDAYRLGKFGREEYVRMALRNQAPIVPFLTIGPAEIYPILAKIEWSWWKRYSEWPCFPITPTFPHLPLPLPTKWHTLFLEPLHIDRQYPPEAAEDDGVVQAIGREVRGRMEEALTWMLGRRRRIFFGSIFGEEGFRPRTAVGSRAEEMAAIYTS